MWHIYTVEYYSAIKNNEFLKFLGKWMELENIILSEVTQSQKTTLGIHSLIIGYYPFLDVGVGEDFFPNM